MWLSGGLGAQAHNDTSQRGRQADTGVVLPSVAPGTQHPPLSVLTRIAQIRIGDPATLGRPVRVEGVVTYVDPTWSLLFVQDAEEGIFVQMRGLPIEVRAGDQVAVEGRSAPGDFAPIIDAPRVTRLGRGRVPEPARPSFQELLTGNWDSRSGRPGCRRFHSETDPSPPDVATVRPSRVPAMLQPPPG